MKEDTKIVKAGRNPDEYGGAVNPPVYHVSTVLFDSLEDFEARRTGKIDKMVYGRWGTPTSQAFERAVAEVEGGFDAVAYPSGLAAIAGALMAFVKSGDHILMTDSTYSPSRRVCDNFLTRWGVETTYYDPLIGGNIGSLIQPNTRIVFTEAPGSLTFEVQDIPAIAAVAHEHDAVVMMDNTWASPLFYKPFERGVDISIQAATKYIVGHSDAMLGTATATEATFDQLRDSARSLGNSVAPDDHYLGQRGLRTLAVRLRQHEKNAITIANWVKARPEVIRVMHPALPDDPGHEIWKRDFLGSSGLFGFVMKSVSHEGLGAFLNEMEHFGMGASWGGYESLVLPTQPETSRTATEWKPGGQTMRLHVGLEDVDDLIEDLDAAFARMNAVS
jgi:cystathionine beta-lyase